MELSLDMPGRYASATLPFNAQERSSPSRPGTWFTEWTGDMVYSSPGISRRSPNGLRFSGERERVRWKRVLGRFNAARVDRRISQWITLRLRATASYLAPMAVIIQPPAEGWPEQVP